MRWMVYERVYALLLAGRHIFVNNMKTCYGEGTNLMRNLSHTSDLHR